MQTIESIIIGGGPCGLSAAIEQKKKGIETLVIEKGNIVDAIYLILRIKLFSLLAIN